MCSRRLDSRGRGGVLRTTLTLLLALFPVLVGATSPPALSQAALSVHKGLVTAEVQDADLRQLLSALADKAGIDLILDPQISGRVRLSVHNTPLDQVFDQLCRNQAIVYRRDEGTGAFVVTGAGFFASEEGPPVDPAGIEPPAVLPPGAPPVRTGAFPLSPAPDDDENRRDSRGRLLFQPRELLVSFREGVSPQEIEALHRNLGSAVLSSLTTLRLQRIRIGDGLPLSRTLAAYNASPLVAVAERHVLRYKMVASSPNDPYFPSQWGLAKMGFPEAWALVPNGKEVVVAVIDTGVDYTHPDLEGRIWTNPGEIPGNGVDDDSNGYIDDVRGWDLAGTYADSLSDADNDPLDKDGHGTHVAGIAAATTNNGTGIAGLLPRGKLMVLKVQADVTGGARDTMLIADIIAAYAYARTNGARIVNCSFGGAAESTLEHEELTRLKAAGLLVVCAAGNRGSNLDTSTEKIYPACYGRGTASLPALEHILSVASMTALDNLVSTSNYGMASVHLAAPGDNVISTCLGNTYCNISGTSMATPHVSGLAGLIWSKNPQLTYGQVRAAILDNVDRIAGLESKVASGGRGNAQRSLMSVLVPGDLNNDGWIDLLDAVLAIQTAGGRHPEDGTALFPAAAPGGTGRIGLPEALYALQCAAGLRNKPPVMAPLASLTVPEKTPISFVVNASDEDGDTLVYSATELPEGAAFDPATRIFTWMPAWSQGSPAGTTYEMVFTATDARGDSASRTVRITVLDAVPLFTAADYFFLHPGDWWEYTQWPDGATTRTTVQSQPETIGGTPTFVFADSSGMKDFFTSDAGGIRLHGEYVILPDVYEGILVYDHPILYLRAQAAMGESNTDTAQSTSIPGVTLQIRSETTVLGVEDVPTAHSLLRDCIKVSNVITGTVNGLSVAAQTVYYWFHRGVGCVKQQSAEGTEVIASSFVNGILTHY